MSRATEPARPDSDLLPITLISFRFMSRYWTSRPVNASSGIERILSNMYTRPVCASGELSRAGKPPISLVSSNLQ
ncbi:hypothetical protein BpHYR1_052966 [Brachionus plicatilis]|uniref:Uncharacterized protein n=1 Tax=Brachionus plicatilis TaxID=10195 RepID=A0A3M7RV24_BRAPC|nr:hypothetical protein BpHYR1_052966 [Brachionus plicatilis]